MEQNILAISSACKVCFHDSQTLVPTSLRSVNNQLLGSRALKNTPRSPGRTNISLHMFNSYVKALFLQEILLTGLYSECIDYGNYSPIRLVFPFEEGNVEELEGGYRLE